MPCALLAILALVLALAGCAGETSSPGARSTSATTPAATLTAIVTAAPGPLAVRIADLTAFRQRLTNAFTSGAWEGVAPLLSPAFSFQGDNTGGGKLVMPGAATEFEAFYTGNAPWYPLSQRTLGAYQCFAGTTPQQQQMAFKGGNGWMALMGIERWQGYWVVAWTFQNLQGGPGYCAAG